MNDFSDIFSNASISDFIVETSAVRESINRHGGFEHFTETQLEHTRMTFLMTDAQHNPLGVLANAAVIRVFVPDNDESVGMFINRLAREAKAMKATWVYAALVTEVGSYEVEAGTSVPDPIAAVSTHVEPLRKGIIWYAEENSPTGRHSVTGAMWSDGKSGLMEKRNGTQPFPLMALILGDV